ncbi:MAG: hypothetical protein U0Y68_08920 [Blastocatellia bacterium]
MKKVGVLVGNCHGFVGNRMFFQYMREAYSCRRRRTCRSRRQSLNYHFGMAMACWP